MKALALLAPTLFWHAAASAASPVAECRPGELDGRRVSYEDVKAHRQGPLPPVEYAVGETPGELWGFSALMAVDATGRVRCYMLEDSFGGTVAINAPRSVWLQQLTHLRYRPFPDAQSPQPAVITEYVREVAATERFRPLPEVPLEQVSITLDRSGCYGTCPSYTVEIRGDGRVTYTGRAYVDVEGTHTYTIPVAEVQRLVDRMREMDIWSANDEYAAEITDNPEYVLTVRMSDQTHSIRDYVGSKVGMPATITAFQDEVDAVAGTEQWIRLSADTVDRLVAEGFDFASPEGGALLQRAAAHSSDGGDEALLRLIAHGARIDGQPPDERSGQRGHSLLTVALQNGRVGVADALIAARMLETDGRVDPAKVDAAFRAAITGGRLAAVEAVWAAAGDTPPALSFDDAGEDGDEQPVHVPVTLMLRAPYDDDGWQGLRIAQWLAARGCDLHAAGADGRTLLHIAADASDLAFVRYLLEQGFDPNTPGRFDLPALGSVHDEDVALLLLEAGTDVAKLSDEGARFRDFAKGNYWQRVIAWLDAKGM